jgi:hypothetical protein
VTAPLATPVGAKPKTPAAPTAAAKPEKAVSKPEKTAQKTEKPTSKPEKATPKPAVQSPEPKAAKPDTAPKLVATLDKEMAARKQADALTKQGQRAIVKKAKEGGKTVYQVWIPATPATKPKTEAKTAKPR